MTLKYPSTRMRRLRRTPWLRQLVAESRLSANDLILGLILTSQEKSEVNQDLPGLSRYCVSDAVSLAKKAHKLGIPAVSLFPFIDSHLKDETGREAINPDNIVCRTVCEIKNAVPEIGVMCDVALDPFTSHGHDGLLKDHIILNDETVDILCQQAVTQAQAGCDILGPSDMMDGRIGQIRQRLDREGFSDRAIMSYCAKYASAFYGPYRDAIGSAAVLDGDKKTYQMDPANGTEALNEMQLDLDEGADMLLVKPGLPYLDVVFRLAQKSDRPVFAFQVSGEYGMVKAAEKAGYLDGPRALLESLLCFKRAGATGVITYFGIEAAQLLDA